MKIFKWRLNPGGKDGQLKREELYKKGMEYIDRLKDEGENVVEVKEEPNELIISIDDGL